MSKAASQDEFGMQIVQGCPLVTLCFTMLQGSSRSSSSSASHHMTMDELRAVNRYAESTKSLSYLPQVKGSSVWHENGKFTLAAFSHISV